jgi:RNA polymerase sigma-70 factor (sigma-E family)
MAVVRWQVKPQPEIGSRPAGGGAGHSRQERDDAVDALFRTHYRPLLRLAFCLLGQRAAAEDAVQDAFVSAYRHWGALRDPAAAPAYLRSAVINRCRTGIRTRLREAPGPALLLIDHTESSSEDDVVAREERSHLAEAVGRLPRRQREVVVCRYYLELSLAETAGLLGISTGSVKRHAHRGLQALTAQLGEVAR